MVMTTKKGPAPTPGDEPRFETITPTQHVGRTLEAEGIFSDVLGDELPVGDNSPDHVRPGQTGVDTVDLRTFNQDDEYQQGTLQQDAQREETGSDGVAEGSGSASAGDPTDDSSGSSFSALDGLTEPLRTRLPGDTSSDPHTDLGPDNATTAHGTRPVE